MWKCSLVFIIDVNILPTHDVRAIGRKCLGFPRLSAADFLGIKSILAIFHALGTVKVCHHRLNTLARAGRSEGHLLRI